MPLTPQDRAASILAGLQSGNSRQRTEAILTLARSDAETRALVEHEVEESVAAYDGPEDDLSDWRTLDGEPFQFPEEPADFSSEAGAEES